MLMVTGSLAGLVGVALSAAAAHGPGGPNLDTASRYLLLHAPVLLVIVGLARIGAIHGGMGRIAGWLIVLGLVLFCGDLAMRAFRDAALFPMAAPTGGFMLMGGWALLALSAFLAARP